MKKGLLFKAVALLSLAVSAASANVPNGMETDPQAQLQARRSSLQEAADADTSIVAPDLDGLLMKSPFSSPIYLIMHGRRHHIPSPATYNALFKSSCKVYDELLISTIEEGQPLSVGAALLQGDESGAQYLYTNGHKHHISSPDVRVKYCFDPSKILVIKDSILAFIPDGLPLT